MHQLCYLRNVGKSLILFNRQVRKQSPGCSWLYWECVQSVCCPSPTEESKSLKKHWESRGRCLQSRGEGLKGTDCAPALCQDTNGPNWSHSNTANIPLTFHPFFYRLRLLIPNPYINSWANQPAKQIWQFAGHLILHTDPLKTTFHL